MKRLGATHEGEKEVSKKIEGIEWDDLRNDVQQIDMLLGGNLRRTSRWVDLTRHLRFGMVNDLFDILRFDWPDVRSSISKQLYDENEPIPVEAEDLGTLAASHPTGSIATKLKWNSLSAEEFERLIFALISSTVGYENAAWLMHTNAPDRGRDLSVTRVFEDQLTGLCVAESLSSANIGPQRVFRVRMSLSSKTR